MKVTILCGISGAGKSTYVKENCPTTARICSADLYFTRNGEYNFDPSKLPQAHGHCLRLFTSYILKSEEHIVVDNTNTTVAEIAPYAALAQAFLYELEIIQVHCDVETAVARNVHEVPRHVIEAQKKRLDSLDLPPWWPVKPYIPLG